MKKYNWILLCFLLAASALHARAQTSILFCGGVENDKPVGVSDRFYPDSASTYLYALYVQAAPMAMKQVSMELFKQNGNTFEQVGEKQSYTVKPKWKYTYVKCYFAAPGLYKVRLSDASGKQLAEGIVTII
ncbi:MAG: hypothetical protein SH857_04615 [Chitinophagales bacterium]|mgnify:CR=1 FL=1|nr:hypothetical protein [Chitinophagales bacterium]